MHHFKVSQRNTLYLINKSLDQLVTCWMRSELMWQKFNVFLQQTEKGNMSILESPQENNHIPVYQYQCEAAVLQPSTRGSTRPVGPLRSGSQIDPHTPRPHKTPSPYHTHRLDMALASISDCWGRLCRPLCRNLHEKEQQLWSEPGALLENGLFVFIQ